MKGNFKKVTSILFSCLLILSLVTPVSAEEIGKEESNGIAKIMRDEYGVPHIYANSVEDLYTTYGYVMAKDRLFQLEMFKRGNEGTVAEVFGEEYLARDFRVRRDGYSDQEVKQMISEMDPLSQKAIKYFAKGISLYVSEALKNPDEKLSKEFHDYDVTPKAWTGVDVLRIFLASMGLFMDQEQELSNAALLSKLQDRYGEEKAIKMFNDIIWKNDPAAPTSAPGEGNVNPVKTEDTTSVDQTAQGVIKVARKMEEKRSTYINNAAELGLPIKIGSNAMIVGEEKSKSGNALLFGGPQVQFDAPGFLYEVGLHAPGIDAVGSSFIGYPFIMFGATNEFAMTSTAGFGDVVDIFEEKLNPGNSYQYFYNGEWKDMEKSVQTFKVKKDDGSFKEVEKAFYYTVHGPVIEIDEKNNTAYSKAWAFRGTEGQSWAAYLKSNWADSFAEFREAARDVTVTLNWFIADKHGNIGYYHVGKYPIRDERIDPRLPTPGTGEYEWKGFLDPKENPHAENPDTGFVVNWNNKPSPDWSNHENNYKWGGANHLDYLAKPLEKANDVTLDTLSDINYFASFSNKRTMHFKSYLLDVLKENMNHHPKFEEIYTILKDWDNLNVDLDEDGFYDSPAGTIFGAWWENFLVDVFKDDLGDSYNSGIRLIDSWYGNGLMLRVLQGENAPLDTAYDWLNGVQKEEVILKSIDTTLRQLEEKYGENISTWVTPAKTMIFGEKSILGIPHGLGSKMEVPLMDRGSENHYVELTENGPVGHNITPPGQIGFVSKDGTVHSNYQDQLEMFANWEYKTMLFTDKLVKENAESVLLLKLSNNSTPNVKVNIRVDNKDVQIDTIYRNGEHYVKVRDLFERVGYDVKWNNQERMATLIKPTQKLSFSLGSEKAIVNDRDYTMYVKPFVKDQSMYLPIAILADMLDGSINENEDTVTFVLHAE